MESFEEDICDGDYSRHWKLTNELLQHDFKERSTNVKLRIRRKYENKNRQNGKFK